MLESDGDGGCLALRARRVSLYIIASSIHANLTAPLQLPSSSLLETLKASCSIWLCFLVGLDCSGGPVVCPSIVGKS